MSLPTTFAGAKDDLTAQWSNMQITGLQAETDRLARIGIANKQRYLAVSKALKNVPWVFIFALHARESSCNFKTHLHNGDPLTARTYHEPPNRPRGPMPKGGWTWEASAKDALTMKGLQNVTVWSVERMEWEAERYNGEGYRLAGLPSPYVWSGTNNYTIGKYVGDHHYDATHVDTQPGVMALIKRVSELDPSFALVSESEKKTVSQTLMSSPTLLAKLNSFFAMVAAAIYSVWDYISAPFLWAADWIERAFGVLPDATNSAQAVVSQAESITTLLRVPAPVFVMIAFSAGALLFAIIRLTRQKQVS